MNHLQKFCAIVQSIGGSAYVSSAFQKLQEVKTDKTLAMVYLYTIMLMKELETSGFIRSLIYSAGG